MEKSFATLARLRNSAVPSSPALSSPSQGMRVEGCLVTVNGHDQRYFSAAATSALVTTDDGAAGFTSPKAGKVEATDGSTAVIGCIAASSAKVAPSLSQPLLLNVRNRLPSVEQANRLAEVYYMHVAPVRPHILCLLRWAVQAKMHSCRGHRFTRPYLG